MVELVWSGSGAAAARSGSRHRRNGDEIAGNKGWRPSGHRFRGRMNFRWYASSTNSFSMSNSSVAIAADPPTRPDAEGDPAVCF